MDFQKQKWEIIQAENRSGTQEQINQRVRETLNRNISIFDDFENFFKRKFPLKDRVIVEIGCGGGWWLATPIKRGAQAIGFDVSKEILTRAQTAFQLLGLKNYKFYEADSRCLSILEPSSVDYIFEITVFQHIDPEVTRRYLETAHDVLKNDGSTVLQFLMNDKNPYKNPHAGAGTVFYSSSEVREMVTRTNFIIESIYKSWEEGESHWNHYLLRKPRGRIDRFRLRMMQTFYSARGVIPRRRKIVTEPTILDKYPSVHRDPLRE